MANRESEGYVLLNRNILNWRWATTPKTAYLFIIMILHANYKTMDFKGVEIKRGQLVTSIQSLAKSTGLTPQEVRTGILHLKSTKEITEQVTHKYRIITIVNYNDYQEATNRSTKKSTNNQQSINKVSTTREKKVIKGNKEKNNIPPKSPTGGLSPDGDGIPEIYRDRFKTREEYLAWRNQ